MTDPAPRRSRTPELVSVALLAVGAWLGYPTLHRRWNEHRARRALEAIRVAEEQYCSGHGAPAGLFGLYDAGLLDVHLMDGREKGFELAVVVSGSTWSATATPLSPGETGDRAYAIDAAGGLREE